jgi:hypothetical protein
MTKFEELMERYYSLPEAERETDYGIDLLGLAFHHAPPELKEMMDAKLKELDLLPNASFVDDAGNAFFTADIIAEKLGITPEEVKRRYEEMNGSPECFAPLGKLHRLH